MFDEEVDKFETYEDYLDSLVSEEDHKYLEDEETFFGIIKELRNHSETCENEMCKKHEWNKRNVIEVVEIGRNHDLDKSDDSSESSDSDESGSDW